MPVPMTDNLSRIECSKNDIAFGLSGGQSCEKLYNVESLIGLNCFAKKRTVQTMAPLPSNEYARCLVRTLISRVGLFMLISCLGCGDASGTTEDLTSCGDSTVTENAIEPGIGGTRFQPISDGDEVLMVGGFQGGHHLWGAIRLVTGQTTDISAIHFLVCQNDLPIAEQRYRDITGLPQADRELFGVPIVFTGIPPVTALDNMEATVHYAVEVNDTVQKAQARVNLACCGHVINGD